jgi:hypothetical protein
LEFLARYHLRSNAESLASAVKRKFWYNVRSTSWPAQVNEVLCKMITYNITVLIREMYKLGIDPSFSPNA